MGSDTSGLTTLVCLTVNVSYRRDWKMCDINGNVYSEVELVHEDGCFSSNISPWSQALVGKCANHSCMEGYRFALKGDGITCKLAYCIGMPNVATALLHEPFGLYRDLVRDMTYKCEIKLKLRGTPFAVCRNTGIWKYMFICEKPFEKGLIQFGGHNYCIGRGKIQTYVTYRGFVNNCANPGTRKKLGKKIPLG